MQPKFNNFKRGPRKATAKQRVLAEWRGIDLAPEEVIRAKSAKSTSVLIPKILQGIGMDKRRADAEIVRVWDHLLDPNIVKHAKPTGLAKGTLFVTVDSSVWLDEIVRYRRREILQRLQHSFGRDVIQRISFRVG